MSTIIPYLSLSKPFSETLEWTLQQLEELGFRVEQTFDLKTALSSHISCPCPYHGTDECSCQMVILLVRSKRFEVTTMVLHGNNEQTYFSVKKVSGNHSNRSLENSIRNALTNN